MRQLRTPVSVLDFFPREESFLDAALSGLMSSPKRISPKFLYDSFGSELFEQICELPEYYPTRTEHQILATHGQEIGRLVGPECLLIEYGSGSSRKTRVLLEQWKDVAGYVPIDISRDHLRASAESLMLEYPHLRILPICADYSLPLNIDPASLPTSARRVGLFLGSTIGNFEPYEARNFLAHARTLLGREGKLLIGFDLMKDRAVIERAYNDSLQITAAFNLNVLVRMNRELQADFQPENFRHHAWLNDRLDAVSGLIGGPRDALALTRGGEFARIEMSLVSLREQTVSVSHERIRFRLDEPLHTENSYKYTFEGFERIARPAGWEFDQVWTDPLRYFAVALLR